VKRFLWLLIFIFSLMPFSGCAVSAPEAQVVATTLPVYEFTLRLCENTPITVERFITEDISCLHDYSLSVSQAKTLETARVIVISGGNLEDFLADALSQKETVIDSSTGIPLTACEEASHQDHHHEHDPHFWLSPAYAKVMAENICHGLQKKYPQHSQQMEENLVGLISDLETLEDYAARELSQLRCRELITFHDGFSYMAQAFDLQLLKAVEEESGSEASAKTLTELTELIREHKLPAIFTEKNGSPSAAGILQRETGVSVFSLDMAISGNSYFDAMYRNIDTIKEALQ